MYTNTVQAFLARVWEKTLMTRVRALCRDAPPHVAFLVARRATGASLSASLLLEDGSEVAVDVGDYVRLRVPPGALRDAQNVLVFKLERVFEDDNKPPLPYVATTLLDFFTHRGGARRPPPEAPPEVP